jgi:hypothetical protein
MAKKPTKAELADRIEFTVYLLATGTMKGVIKKQLAASYGVDHHTAERYLSRARGIITKESGKTQAEWRLESLNFLVAMRSNPKHSVGNRIKANEDIIKLLALNLPARFEHSGNLGVTVDAPLKFIENPNFYGNQAIVEQRERERAGAAETQADVAPDSDSPEPGQV